MDNHKDMSPDKIHEAVKGESSVYMRMIWNAAIEKAAQKVNDELGCDEIDTYWIEREIRKLKV